MILGTAAYMSPEQAKGKAVDKRTDIWAFGCVLYEMLTGKMAFAGDNITEILAAVVRGEPDWSQLAADTPASVQRLLRRCLTKDPRERLSDIGVARLEIRDAVDTARSTEVSPRLARAPRRSLAWWMLAAGIVGGALVAAIAAWRMWPTPPSLPALRLAIDWPDGLTWAGPSGPGVAISPDGTRIAYVAVSGNAGAQICLQDLRTNEMRVVSSLDSPYNPFFSPDGTQIGFVANGKLWRASLAGGTPFEIGSVDVNDRGVAWSDDGFIYSGEDPGSLASGSPEEHVSRSQRWIRPAAKWPTGFQRLCPVDAECSSPSSKARCKMLASPSSTSRRRSGMCCSTARVTPRSTRGRVTSCISEPAY